MTCTDLVSIIDACGRNGVASINMDNIFISFIGNMGDTVSWNSHSVDSGTSKLYTNDIDVDDEDTDDIDEEELIDELKFTDPVAWEEYIRNGE